MPDAGLSVHQRSEQRSEEKLLLWRGFDDLWISSTSDVGGTAEAMLRGGQEREEEEDDNDDGASLVADGRGSHPDNGGVGVGDRWMACWGGKEEDEDDDDNDNGARASQLASHNNQRYEE